LDVDTTNTCFPPSTRTPTIGAIQMIDIEIHRQKSSTNFARQNFFGECSTKIFDTAHRRKSSTEASYRKVRQSDRPKCSTELIDRNVRQNWSTQSTNKSGDRNEVRVFLTHLDLDVSLPSNLSFFSLLELASVFLLDFGGGIKCLFTPKTIFMSHCVVQQRPTQLGLLLIWSYDTVRHKNRVSSKHTLNSFAVVGNTFFNWGTLTIDFKVVSE
jgi:hypothetical protein